MPSETIQWFPGHMAKTRRLIAENLKNVDIIIEMLDARVPYSSRNPEIRKLTAGKPTILLLNKASLADPEQNRLWVETLTDETTRAILTDCQKGDGISRISPAIREVLHEKIERFENKGMTRKLRAMVVGIPNVGKSSLINRICGNKKAKVENRPGVTTDKQWVATNIGFDLMDMPGVLWPKFEERTVGENLALTGAIRDGVLDIENAAATLCNKLRVYYPSLLCARYKMTEEELRNDGKSGADMAALIGRKRGFLIPGGEVDTERTARMLLEEFRAGKIGRITLDRCREKKAEVSADADR